MKLEPCIAVVREICLVAYGRVRTVVSVMSPGPRACRPGAGHESLLAHDRRGGQDEGLLHRRLLRQASCRCPAASLASHKFPCFFSGLVTSLAHPNGNTTGVSGFARELDGKRQEILIEAVPGLRQMAVLADAYNSADDRKLEAAARARNVALSIYRVTKGDEIVAAIDTAHASGATGLVVQASATFFINRQIIMDRVAALRLPTMYASPEVAEEGGFAGYGPRLLQLFGEVLARQLARLFRGTKVVDIPVEQPTKFELVINLKTAKALGVTVPEALLVRADKVIE